MQTKKEIFQWWVDRGKIIDTSKEGDFENLIKSIDKVIDWTKGKIDEKHFKIKMVSPRWKYPLYLAFYCLDKNENTAECYQIINF